eukprot:678854_1
MSLRCNGHLRSWIKVNKIKGEFSNDMLSECMESILNLYGSHKDLLNFLIINSPKQPLDEMYKVLQKTLEIHKMKSMNDINPNAISIKNNNKPLKMDINRISTTSIETICGFLKRKQIERFKPCNRAIAIICLNEMMKSSITICHATQLLNTKLKPCARSLMLLRHNPSHFVKYNANATYPFILPDNVRNSSQIPIAIDRNKKHHLVSNQKIYPKSSLIIFNKSDITRIESNNYNVRKLASNDVFVAGDHIILALQYFNVHKQEFSLIKYLMIDRDFTLQRLIHYIINTLVPNNTDGTFDGLNSLVGGLIRKLKFRFLHQRLQQTMEPALTTRNPDEFNRCLIQYFRNHQIVVSLAFQAGITVDKDRKFEFEVTNLALFHQNMLSYLLGRKTKILTVKLGRNQSSVNELQRQMKHCMTLKHQSEQVISDTMQSMDALQEGISIKQERYLPQNTLKHYISRTVLNSVVDAKNITLPRFSIVPYDTTASCDDDRVIYSISLFDESQAPFPFHCNAVTRNPICIDIKIKKRFTPSDMMEQLIKIAKDPVFNYKFKSIEATLSLYGTQITCYAFKDLWRYSHAHHKSYSVLFEHDDPIEAYGSNLNRIPLYLVRSGSNSNLKIPLYLVPKWCSKKCSNEAESNIFRVIIRFAWSGTINCQIVNMHEMRKHLVGLPLTVWLTYNDSLQDIIQNNPTMQQFHDIMVETFVVNFKMLRVEVIRLIETAQRNQLHFSEDNGNIVVVTLRKSTDNSIHVDQHSLTESGSKQFVLNKFDFE